MRVKASSESTALTAGLRKEQMRNESLEQALQQKVRGILLFLQATQETFSLQLYMTTPVFFLQRLLYVVLNLLVVLPQNQEIEELTKICDELIAKMGKTD